MDRFQLDRTTSGFRILVNNQVHTQLGEYAEPQECLMRLREVFPDETGRKVELNGHALFVDTDTVLVAVDYHYTYILADWENEIMKKVGYMIRRLSENKLSTETIQTVREHLMNTIPKVPEILTLIEEFRSVSAEADQVEILQKIRPLSAELGPYVLIRAVP